MGSGAVRRAKKNDRRAGGKGLELDEEELEKCTVADAVAEARLWGKVFEFKGISRLKIFKYN